MFGSTILEIAIGLILVFLLFSLIVTATCEAVQLLMKTRARELERGLAEILQDREHGEVREAFYNHPLIYALYRGPYTARSFGPQDGTTTALGRVSQRLHSGGDLPSYIPRGQFSTVLIDLWQRGEVNAAVKTALSVLAQQSGGDPGALRAKVEAWYDAAMERASGTFKRYTQQFSLVIGFALAAALNLNTLAIVEALSTNPTLREAIVAAADDIVEQAAAPQADVQAPPAEDGEGDDAAAEGEGRSEEIAQAPQVKVQALIDAVAAAGLPMGWDAKAVDRFDALTPLGWLIMALAGTLGAPFWFDLLKKFVNVRSTMKPEEAPQQEPQSGGGGEKTPLAAPAAAGSPAEGEAADLPSGPTPDNVSPYSYG